VDQDSGDEDIPLIKVAVPAGDAAIADDYWCSETRGDDQQFRADHDTGDRVHQRTDPGHVATSSGKKSGWREWASSQYPLYIAYTLSTSKSTA